MIEKIEMPEMDETYKSAMFAKVLGNKINELVDATNELQLAKDVMFSRIDMLNNAICDMRIVVENGENIKKKLDIAVGALTEISLRFQNEEDAIEKVWSITATEMCNYADEALEQINNKETK